ncbi:MAG: lysophospholipid acyltransferase family protein [Acidobacteria bacterium]|nr:lysophospholipid acyltransferase family protein [Acidobacteriota bacterium]
MRDPKQIYRRRLRNLIARPLTFVLKLCVGTVSWHSAQRIGAWLGRRFWKLKKRDRTRTLAHLEIAFPALSAAEKADLGRRAAIHLGVNFAEYLHLAHRGPEAAVAHFEIRGWEHVEAARSQAKVVLIATAHCGNWELMGPVFRSKRKVLTALVRSMGEEWMENASKRFRERLGTQAIARGESGAAGQLLALRKRGGYLIALIDQDIRAQSVYVPFFGRLAHTPVGPAQLALRWSMPVVPAFCERLEDGSHRIEFSPPLPPFDSAKELTAAITRVIEGQVRKRPEQWVWVHRRWRRQLPDDTEYLARDLEGSQSG